VALDSALGAANALAGDAPQQALALVAVGGRGGRPQHKIVRRCARDGVDERLQRLLVHVHFLWTHAQTPVSQSQTEKNLFQGG